LKQVVLFDAPENIDQKVVFLARVSSENQDNPKYEGLMNYLIREGHWSPLDMVNLTFEINTEKDVGIQLLRHQTIKPQEWSQRYADCSNMKAPLRECRVQDEKNRQNSFVSDDLELIMWWVTSQLQLQEYAFNLYEQALKKGLAKELARSLLPIGLTSTKMYFNASLRSWLFYCLSRTHISTQKEHRTVAKEVLIELLSKAPCATNAFIKLFMLPKQAQYDFDFDLLSQ
jgi:thymidylate synthase (FAD)